MYRVLAPGVELAQLPAVVGEDGHHCGLGLARRLEGVEETAHLGIVQRID